MQFKDRNQEIYKKDKCYAWYIYFRTKAILHNSISQTKTCSGTYYAVILIYIVARNGNAEQTI